jgi:hypothetical protein
MAARHPLRQQTQKPQNQHGLTEYGDWRDKTHLQGRQLDHPKYGKPFAENNHVLHKYQKGLESVSGYWERRHKDASPDDPHPDNHWVYIQSHNKALNTHNIHPLQHPRKLISKLRVNTETARRTNDHIVHAGDNNANNHVIDHEADRNIRDVELDDLRQVIGDGYNDDDSENDNSKNDDDEYDIQPVDF